MRLSQGENSRRHVIPCLPESFIDSFPLFWLAFLLHTLKAFNFDSKSSLWDSGFSFLTLGYQQSAHWMIVNVNIRLNVVKALLMCICSFCYVDNEE